MAQAMEAAKKNLGLKSPGDKENSGKPQKPDSMSELEAAIDLVDNIEAKELLNAKARQVKADLELRAKESEDKAHRYKGNGGEGENGDHNERTKLKLELTANAMTLLEKGVDPHVVASYILGTSGPQFPINMGGGGGVQGFTVADVIALADKFRSNGPSAEVLALQKTIEEMRTELRTLKPTAPAGAPVDPMQVHANYLKSVNELVDSLVKAGLVVKPGAAGTGTGDNIEWEKEKNRHSEKLEEIKETKDYHTGLVETLQDTTERIGEGLAQRAEFGAEEKEGAVAKEGLARETFTCPDCKIKIPIYPETPDQVTCTKCGQIFKRTMKTVEVKQ
jgi:hypothetical protein